MSQAESSTNVADVAAASEPPEIVAFRSGKVAESESPVTSGPDADTVAAVVKLPADSAIAVSAGPPVHPAIWGIGLLVFAALFFGGVYIGQDFLVERPHNAGLYVEPKYLDFGEVWAEEAFKWRIPIHNKSDREVGIAEFTASCQCSLIEPASLTIPPHSTAEVVATINLTIGRDTEPNEQARKFEIAIHPIVAVPTSRPPGFVLRGQAKDVFRPSPRAVELGEILSRTAGEPRTIRLKPATPLSNLTALPQPDMTIDIQPIPARDDAAARGAEASAAREGEARAEPSASRSRSLPLSASPSLETPIADSLPPTASDYLLTVTPSDQIPLGKINRTILLQATDIAGNDLPIFPVTVTGEIVFDVAIEPHEIYAGLIEMGKTYETLLTLKSRTDSRFSLIPVEQEPGVSLTPLSHRERFGVGQATDATPSSDSLLAEDGVHETFFRLRLSAESSGDQRTIARFQAINLTTGEQADLNLPIVYYGANQVSVRRKHLFNAPTKSNKPRP